jgi:hypothetical protein
LAPAGGGDLSRLGRLGEKSAFDKHGRHGGFSQDSKASTLHPAIKRGKPAQHGLIESGRQNQIDRFQGMAVFALAVMGLRLPLSGWWRTLRRDGEDFQPGCTPPTGGIEMNADEDSVRIFSGEGRTGLEGNKDVRIA